MKIDVDGLSQLIGLLYDASTQTSLWPTFCTTLMTQMQSIDVNLQLMDLPSNLPRVLFSTTPPEFLQTYFAYYHNVSPFYQRGAHLMRTGYIGRSHQIIQPSEFEESEFHRDFFRKFDLFHTCNLTPFHDAQFSANIGLARPKKTGIYDDEDEQLLRLLMPHLQRAFRITNFVGELNDQNQVLAAALHKLPQGVIVLSQIGQILFINSSAKRITDGRDGLLVNKQGQLEAISARDTNQLRKLTALASASKLDVQAGGGGVLQLDRPSGLRPLSLLVAPLNRDAADLNFRQPAALIFITDPEAQLESSEQLVQRLYQLTPAEARLALLLTQGKSVVEASAELQVTPNTTRTHLKRIFQKTGAKRQSDLVKLLLNSPASLK